MASSYVKPLPQVHIVMAIGENKTWYSSSRRSSVFSGSFMWTRKYGADCYVDHSLAAQADSQEQKSLLKRVFFWNMEWYSRNIRSFTANVIGSNPFGQRWSKFLILFSSILRKSVLLTFPNVFLINHTYHTLRATCMEIHRNVHTRNWLTQSLVGYENKLHRHRCLPQT